MATPDPAEQDRQRNLQAILRWSLAQQGDGTQPPDRTQMDPEVIKLWCIAGCGTSENGTHHVCSVVHRRPTSCILGMRLASLVSRQLTIASAVRHQD